MPGAPGCGASRTEVDRSGGGRDAEGASVLLEVGPPAASAVIGGRAPAGRRRWTAAHELGHHLLADEYHSDVGVAASRDEREKVVDAFAGELLLPAADLRGAFAQAAAMPGGELRRAMVRLAGTYRGRAPPEKTTREADRTQVGLPGHRPRRTRPPFHLAQLALAVVDQTGQAGEREIGGKA